MPYHKKRHPWRNQDLRSDDKRAAEPRLPPPTIVLPAPATVIAGPWKPFNGEDKAPIVSPELREANLKKLKSLIKPRPT